MPDTQNPRLSFWQALSYSRRGFAIWWRAEPMLLLSAALRQTVDALSPYLPLYFTARLVNALAGGGDAGQVWAMLLALLASAAGMGALQAAARCWDETMAHSHQTPTWNRLFFEKLLAMDFQDVDDPKTQALLTKIQQDRNWSGWGLPKLYTLLSDAVGALCRILGAVALSVSLFTLPVPPGSPLGWLNHPLCLAGMAALLLLSVLLSGALSNRAQGYWARYDGTQGNRLFTFLYFIGMRERHRGTDIRTYAQDRFLESKAREDMEGEYSFGPKSSIGKAAKGPMGACRAGSGAVSQVFVGAIYLFAGLKALGGAFGVGSVTQYAGALAGLAQGLTRLLEVLGALRTNAGFLQSTFAFLDIPNRMYQGSLTTEKRADRNYQIEFRDVSFRYPGTSTWALRHVSMKFPVGARLAVVGENGSGKTTFIKLLCRLYDPTQGEILLNGIDIRKYRYDNYLSLFSVVFQDFKLLAQPLGQNVAASEHYDRRRAKECLLKAGFGARLAELPQGLDTCLYREFEDDGVEVSGGEAQKIALARVLYQDAPFIVLDEPTAALDPEAEAEVYTRFNDIVEDKTAVYISHRLSSCRFCDDILVFQGGRVVQQGPHSRLVETPGPYQSLWEAQAQYYQNEPTPAQT
ncbi:ABC transporter ATP-binding protein [Acutalibacter caecimuris]|uniref:ABC transporter ATP-binding protein n=1 Tax=Acutalibacter caecimuris TaxID=3093657 RepID=UPI002AC944CE|nr:ABC transporter ATP-binding protein [Acutalibacter sp. M00118]